MRCGQEILLNPKKRIYYIDYYWGFKRVREKVGPSKTLAETVLKKRQVEAAENKHLDVKRELKVKFDDFAREYIELHCKVNNKFWLTTDSRIINVLKRHFSGRCLHEITPHLVEKFKSDRMQKIRLTPKGNKKQGLKPATVNRQLACLKSMFNKAITWGRFAGANPVNAIE